MAVEGRGGGVSPAEEVHPDYPDNPDYPDYPAMLVILVILVILAILAILAIRSLLRGYGLPLPYAFPCAFGT